MGKIIYIYGLVDPRDDKLRYVGQTSNLYHRLWTHKNKLNRTHKACWIKGILLAGLEPELVILEESHSKAEADILERFWIASLRSAGARLVNIANGGDGGPVRAGMKNSEEPKRRIAETHKGIRPNEETRLLMSRQRKGRDIGKTRSPEARLRIAEGTRRAWEARKASPEARKRTTEAVKQGWQKRKFNNK